MSLNSAIKEYNKACLQASKEVIELKKYLKTKVIAKALQISEPTLSRKLANDDWQKGHFSLIDQLKREVKPLFKYS